jgi:hypothetical protein
MELDNTKPQHPSQGEAPSSDPEVTVPPDAGQDTSKTQSPATQDEDLKSVKPEVDTPSDAAQDISKADSPVTQDEGLKGTKSKEIVPLGVGEDTNKVESPVVKGGEFKSTVSEESSPPDVREDTSKTESPVTQDQDFIIAKPEEIVPHEGGKDITNADSPVNQETIFMIAKPKVATPNDSQENEINRQSRFSEDTESACASSTAEVNQGYNPNIRGISYEGQRYIPTQKQTSTYPGSVYGYRSEIGGQSQEDYHQNIATPTFTTNNPQRPLNRIPNTRGLGREDSDEYHQYLAKAPLDTTYSCPRPVPVYYPKTRGLSREDYEDYHQYWAAQEDFTRSNPGLIQSYSPKARVPNQEGHQNIATQTSTSHTSLVPIRSLDLDESYHQPDNDEFRFRSIGISLVEIRLRRGEDGRREWSAKPISDTVCGCCSIM